MNKVYITGDLHGNVDHIEKFIHNNYDTHCFDCTDTMILLGDAGLNYYLNKKDDFFKKQLSALPMNFFVIRGNHEARPSNVFDKNKWHIEIFFDNEVYVENEYPNIKYAMDTPTVYEIKGKTVLIYPGAYSVDKHYRLMQGWRWFKDEQLTSEEMQVGRIMAECYKDDTDIILSHTAPEEFEPRDLFIPSISQSTVDKTMESYLQEIHEMVNYKLWCWGHYHADRLYPSEDGKNQVMFFRTIKDLEILYTQLEKIK